MMSRFRYAGSRLPDVLDDFFFSQDYEYVMGASRGGDGGQVVDLVIGHTIAELNLPGMPHLGSGITWETGWCHGDGDAASA